MKTIYNLISLLSPSEKREGLLVVILSLLMGISDALGAASIMPFLSLIENPEIIEKNRILSFIKINSGISEQSNFIFLIGLLVFFLLVISLIMKTLTSYVQIRFSVLREQSIGKRLFKLYLSQSYDWFLNKNSTEIAKNILSETNEVMRSALLPFTTLISSSIVSVSMFTLMIIVNAKIALTVLFLFLVCYVVVFISFKNIVYKLGKEKFLSNQERFKAVNEVFGAFKEVKLSNLESSYLQKFSEPALVFANRTATAKLIGSLPRFALEIVAFGGMFIVLLFLLRVHGDISYALPMLGLYAFAGYRILPSLQLIYQSITAIKYSSVAVNTLYYDFVNLRNKKESRVLISRHLHPYKKIELRNIFYKYPNKNQNVLKNINISIDSFKSTAIVGFTGSGKTTLIDIILCLLKPQKGEILIDDFVINNKNCFAWQKSIGYVPQNIFLSDESIKNNIAFGYEDSEINFEKIREVSKVVNLHEFIINELPNKYETFVGEKGVRLSGGQRQRIGIARALYKNPKVLILDEATSALDNITEQIVMKNIYSLNKELTIIVIAHRLTSIKNCDKIYLLEKGEIIDSGNFNNLFESNKLFREMNKTNKGN